MPIWLRFSFLEGERPPGVALLRPQMAAEQASVDLRGMGDIYIAGAKNVRGSLSGIGHVHVPNDASCFLSTSGMGGCDQNNFPPYPPVSCDSLGPSGIVAANAVHWTVSIHGNSCSSSSCAFLHHLVSRAVLWRVSAGPYLERAEASSLPFRISGIKGVRMTNSDTVMDGAVADALAVDVDGGAGIHGHRVPDPCCTTGFSYTGTHCTTHGEHHRCCVGTRPRHCSLACFG